jgi:hypothetical protein
VFRCRLKTTTTTTWSIGESRPAFNVAYMYPAHHDGQPLSAGVHNFEFDLLLTSTPAPGTITTRKTTQKKFCTFYKKKKLVIKLRTCSRSKKKRKKTRNRIHQIQRDRNLPSC